MGLYGFSQIEDAMIAKQVTVERQLRPDLKAGGMVSPKPFWGGGGASSVALATIVIPGRNGDLPGGPVICTFMESKDGANFTIGKTVDVYSWVNSDSPDPADFENGQMYIYISQDRDGTWWYHAIDCLPPPPPNEQNPGDGSAPTTGADVIYVS